MVHFLAKNIKMGFTYYNNNRNGMKTVALGILYSRTTGFSQKHYCNAAISNSIKLHSSIVISINSWQI